MRIFFKLNKGSFSDVEMGSKITVSRINSQDLFKSIKINLLFKLIKLTISILKL